ncbi:MAG: EAL domain-containing protein, partial [Elusimicrobiaceae bacterium]|nr:EAL domain-containing protein [Elusimicrobiaceae bacterium]
MKYKTKGFKRTFLLVASVALLVSGGSVLYWWQISQRLEQDTQLVLRSVGKELAENTTRMFSAELQILTTLAVSLEDSKLLGDKSQLSTYLFDQNKRNPFVLTGFQFADGQTLFSNGKAKQNFLSKSMIDATYEHSHFISELVDNPFDSEEKGLLLAVPVRNNGHRWGIVFALQPVSAYDDMLDDFSLSNGGLSLIINQQGQVLLAYPRAFFNNLLEAVSYTVFDRGFSEDQIRQDMQEGREGISGYVMRGKHRFSSYYPLGYNGWYAISVLPTASMAEKARMLVFLSLIWCVSIVVVLLLLLIFILRLQYQSSKALYKLGFVDPLTQLDNANAFQLKFPSAVERLREKENALVALVLINVNRFKAVNDIYGFEQGDQVLRQLADVLHQGIKEGELFCRSGADVFLLLLSADNRETLAQRVEDLLEQAGHFCRTEQECMPLSLTGGIYVLEENEPFFIMRDRAQLAWETAKQQVGHRYAFYDDEYKQKMVTEKRIESSMENALQERQFKVYLQPKYSFQTGRLVGAEALVRWIHPAQGMIRPDWFIPVFEKNGFVLKLDQFIWQEVVNLIKKRQEAGLPLVRIGVNFSRLHLDNPQFIETISTVAQQAGVDTKWLEVELTESVVFGNSERMKQVLDGLHAQGFSVAMDDFGAGYSSLNVLKNLDFDCVKLDKEFLARGEGNPRMRHVITGLVHMIKALG